MRISILILALFFAVFAVGCDDGDSSSSASPTADATSDTTAAGGSYCQQNPVTEAKQFCASLIVPDGIT